ncbi:hypothetical protein [Nocardia brasiliensis]|uniref:hypothetical protein n=1 Tax=Nocardia brasiliensis TaxID=37326 RepID=UPI0036729F8E
MGEIGQLTQLVASAIYMEGRDPNHAGTGDTAFPWDEAATVWGAAKRAGIDAVCTLIDWVRDLLGHPEAIPPLTNAWLTSKKQINDSANGATGLGTAKDDLHARWEGEASKAAGLYVTKLIDVAGKTEEILGKMATTIHEFSGIITKIYLAALRFISECAGAVLNFASGMLENFPNPFGMASEAVDALNHFREAVTKLVEEFTKQRQETRNVIFQLQLQASGLDVPDKIADVAISTADGDWRPKPAPAPMIAASTLLIVAIPHASRRSTPFAETTRGQGSALSERAAAAQLGCIVMPQFAWGSEPAVPQCVQAGSGWGR